MSLGSALSMDVESAIRVPRRYVLLSALLVVLLIFSLLAVCAFMTNSDGTSVDGMIYVKNEKELVKTVNDATKPVTIALNKDIKLTKTLTIPANKEITLTNNIINNNFHKLIGAKGQPTVTIEDGGVLWLDTHLTKQAF
jgi:hypothetical protein